MTPRHLAILLFLGAMFGASLVLAPGVILTRPTVVSSLNATAAMFALAIFSTAIAWPMLFRLVAAIGPTASSTVTFLTPAFGIGWGAIVLGENVGPSLVVEAGLILVSVGAVVGLRNPTRPADIVDGLWTTVRGTAPNPQVGG